VTKTLQVAGARTGHADRADGGKEEVAVPVDLPERLGLDRAPDADRDAVTHRDQVVRVRRIGGGGGAAVEQARAEDRG
jgi:hypothetical protein